MSLQSRLEAIEKKLGIEPPVDGPVLIFDDGQDMFDGGFYPTHFNNDGDDNTQDYNHYVELTPEIVNLIKALPVKNN